MTVRRRFPWWPTAVGITLLLALLVLVYLRAKAPPEAARLLPESDAIVYANLRPLRSVAGWQAPNGATVTMHRSPDFQAFVDATGIVPERDLDSVALALHRMADPRGPNGAVAYSEVFTGRFDAERLRRYLAGLARSTEQYAGQTVYNVPVQGRTLRLAVLAYDTVAGSNTPTPEQMHSMLDRSRASGLWRPGSSLLAARYGDVPLLSQAWGIGRIGLPFGQNGHLNVMGFDLPVPVDTEFIASLRYSGNVHLRVEEIAPDALAAQHTSDAVNGLLSLIRGLAGTDGPQGARDAAMRSVLSSTAVHQKANMAVLTTEATVAQTRLLTTGLAPAPASSSTGSMPKR